ncbi:hypothetical protein SacN8_11240 [Sulfolobus acidocaldarius N8]|uniref:Uncharacterized protein n=2 Tax=Sulfolobus acidocaldarius TaxID=2285 RepID=M1JFU3_9CREN|nr:hypothetical protein SacN8_11240 [Sulfolobus acidocaldarius N8]AGE74510.1 hypothetical protein SacRon12I_11480 [Sulfolobus acidocaldarius Ron12/I]
MARRECPKCKKVVEIKVSREGKTITKSCPICGYVFIKYEVKHLSTNPSAEPS